MSHCTSEVVFSGELAHRHALEQPEAALCDFRRQPAVTKTFVLWRPRQDIPRKAFCHGKRIAQDHPKRPFECANHRRRRLGEGQRVHKLRSKYAGQNAGATVAQAGLALECARRSAHGFEHARRRRRGTPKQRRRIAEVLELLVVVVLLDHRRLLLYDVYATLVPARQPRPSHQLLARSSGATHQFASYQPKL